MDIHNNFTYAIHFQIKEEIKNKKSTTSINCCQPAKIRKLKAYNYHQNLDKYLWLIMDLINQDKVGPWVKQDIRPCTQLFDSGLEQPSPRLGRSIFRSGPRVNHPYAITWKYRPFTVLTTPLFEYLLDYFETVKSSITGRNIN